MEVLALSTLITTIGATLVLVLKTIQQSRCTSVNACCVSCERDIPSIVEPTPAGL